jgi:PAT family beta-lactamase induction signal transducer AmpG
MFPALGRRRPWLLVAQCLAFLTAAALVVVPEGDLRLLGWLVFVHNVFVGLQDVAVDALTVDMLEGRDRERACGMMYGSSYLGTFLGGAGLGIVAARRDLSTAIALMAALQAAMFLMVLACRERPGDRYLLGWFSRPAVRPAHAPPHLLGMARALVLGMTRPAALRAAVGAFSVKILPAALLAIMTVELIERLGWSRERFSAVTGSGVLFGLVSGVAGGFLSGWLGPRLTALLANVLVGAAWITFSCLSRFWDRSDIVFGWVALDAVCLAMSSVALFGIFMRVASPAVAATQFTASMALMNFATSCGSWLAGPLATWCDTPTAFLVAGCLQPLGCLLLPRTEAAPVTAASAHTADGGA